MVFTLLLAAIEVPLVYEIREAFNLAWDNYCIVICVFGIINSLLLRRYVLILRRRHIMDYREPRFACHLFILMASAAFIMTGNDIEHDARTDVYHSRTLDGLKFNEAEYFYIDSLPQIDIAHYGTYIERRVYSVSRFFDTTYFYTGCYVAPFRGFGDVFYVVTAASERSREYVPLPSKYIEEKTYANFEKGFDEMCEGIKPTFNNHLFQLLPHESKSCYYFAIDNAYERDTVNHGITYSYRAVALAPVKNDQMPRWTDKFPLLFLWLVFYFLFLLMVYTGSKTVSLIEN